jgi:hypothetical protein
MLDDDLSLRVRRLLSGQHRIDDLDRLYLGQRQRSGNRPAFREIGDFVAHRDGRDKGLLTQTARDVFVSFDVWSLGLRRLEPSRDDIVRAAEANLRLASDEQLKAGCGVGRQTVRKRLAAVIEKTGRGERLKASEIQTLQYLGNHFIWKPAFTGHQLFEEFAAVLRVNGLIGDADAAALEGAKAFILLHALAVMHGSAIVLDSGGRARLFAGYANKDRWLEVKVELTMPGFDKPVWAPIAMFYTDLRPEEHCHPDLVLGEDPIMIDHWDFPLDVAQDRLTRLA